jgi:hypothetical protein
MRFGWVAVALGFALAVALSGCLSGQTGSPDCFGAMSCICDPLYGGGTLLRVHAERVESGKLEAVVDEVFASIYGDGSSVAVGDRVGGSMLAEQPCAPDTAPAAQAGAELFVLYSPGYSPQSGEDPLDGVFSFAIPWADTLSFGGSKELSSSELAVLSTPESCQQRFPPPPAPPCDDTQTGVACSAAPRSGSGGADSFVLLLGLLAVLSARARRSRRQGCRPSGFVVC